MGMLLRRHYAKASLPEVEKVPEPIKVEEPTLEVEEEVEEIVEDEGVEISYAELKKLAKSKGVDVNTYRSRVDIEEQLKLIG